MRNLKVVVIVPEGQKYKLASCFSTDRLESLKRKGFDVEVEKLVGPNIGFDEIENEAIVLDARSESKIHFRMPESYYTLLTHKEFGILARTLRYQMWNLDDSDRIFMNDIRSLCEYVICHCPDDVFDVIFAKYTFATVGAFQNVNAKSEKYLTEIIESTGVENYRDDYYYSDILGTTYYLLARNERDQFKKHSLMMKSLAYHELCSLNSRRFPDAYNVAEYALSMIEIGRMLQENPSYNPIYGQYAAYEKAIYIMEHQFVDVVWPDIQTMEPDIKQCNWEYLKYEIGIVEKRLSQVAPQEFHGQIERYLECCK